MKPRPAATLVLLRQGTQGPEILMIQRTQNAAFLGGAYVFPGGAIDAADDGPGIAKRILGLNDEQASARLNLASGGIAYYVAAIRECLEESGIALLVDKNGQPVGAQRAAALDRKMPFLDLLESEDLFVPAGSLAYFGHWITAPGRSRRFDARFFVALAPEGQEGTHDESEVQHQLWVRPVEALERGRIGEIELVTATQQTLTDLSRFDEVDAAFTYARGLGEIETNRACRALDRSGTEKVFRRWDPQYHEIHWSDPDETGTTGYELVPGVPKRLDRLVTRIIAPNPGAMTGPGTNTYLVGENDLAVIDPGPAIDSHVEKILEEAKGRIRWILCTHTHLDHSPAAAILKRETGAAVYGRPAPEGQDATFQPDLVPEPGQRVAGLRAIHTPGHASNHLCYLLEETRMLFTGDHVMQGSTVVINPPDGDMRAYLASLAALLEEDVAILAPGHGYLIGHPHKEVRRLIAHRKAREDKVLDALRAAGAASLEEMLPRVYDDVPERMHRWAARSLTAHLQKLVAEGTLRADGGRYTLVQSPQHQPRRL